MAIETGQVIHTWDKENMEQYLTHFCEEEVELNEKEWQAIAEYIDFKVDMAYVKLLRTVLTEYLQGEFEQEPEVNIRRFLGL
jgi:hypothetical protein